MNFKLLSFACLSLLAIPVMKIGAETTTEETNKKTLTFFDAAVFYDGYQLDSIFDADKDDGILRLRNSLYSKKMTADELDAFGDVTTMDVTIGALCDNYDRIGNINLALVPKGQEKYSIDDEGVERIELGRFITPFMNKNKRPKEVPYSYQMDYIGRIFHDSNLREKYDFWLEFELFGVPYAANQQIFGCSKRNDVFAGTLSFTTTTPASANTDDNVLVPINMKVPEYQAGNLCNYNELGTDTIGKTTKTYKFNLEEDVNDSQIVLITSNHGADTNGEEYNRRWHYIYFDDALVLTYKPGRESCEPFRKYNTQGNGIYGGSAKTDAEWQSFSNWCPGDVIDNRIIHLGAMKKGEHKVRISVPDAVFAGGQGYIPVSLYLQGAKTGELPEMGGISSTVVDPEVSLVYSGDDVLFTTDREVVEVEIYSLSGQCMYRTMSSSNSVSLASLAKGVYLLNLYLDNDVIETHKIVRK